MVRNINTLDFKGISAGGNTKAFIKDLPLILNMLDDIEVAIVAVNRDGVIFYANEKYGKHIGQPIHNIISKRLPDVYEGSTTMTALKTKKRIIVERKVCPVDDTKYVTGVASPFFDGDELLGAYAFYMDIPSINVGLETETEKLFTTYVKQKLFDSVNELGGYDIIGQSAAFLNIIERASVIAETDVPVMIRGESGVGKEVIAQYIHRKSHRQDKPFIVINCAAIPDTLVESELFGYEGGSFTGAKAKGKPGKFELANGGTLFLDEIGDMPLSMQPKLLRAIQEKEIERIGGTEPIPVDLRIISATNQPLEKMILAKKFREDLYYRINSFALQISPLRERREDVSLFVDYYLNQFNKKYKKNLKLSAEALSLLYHYSWPGNVREIRNCMENVVIMCENDECSTSAVINYLNDTYENLHEERIVIADDDTETKTLRQIIADVEKCAIAEVLEKCNNNKTEAMRLLGLSRKTFYRKMNDYKLMD